MNKKELFNNVLNEAIGLKLYSDGIDDFEDGIDALEYADKYPDRIEGKKNYKGKIKRPRAEELDRIRKVYTPTRRDWMRYVYNDNVRCFGDVENADKLRRKMGYFAQAFDLSDVEMYKITHTKED